MKSQAPQDCNLRECFPFHLGTRPRSSSIHRYHYSLQHADLFLSWVEVLCHKTIVSIRVFSRTLTFCRQARRKLLVTQAREPSATSFIVRSSLRHGRPVHRCQCLDVQRIPMYRSLFEPVLLPDHSKRMESCGSPRTSLYILRLPGRPRRPLL